ncbi:MAG: hypothetical protein JWM38_115, partial [Sphingomonas bacterium]|nr:hypothetical protein [Sphingomonas bacterium]
YLASAGDSVGLHFYPLPLDRWLGFQLIETIPYIVAVWMIGVGGRFGRATLAILGASLLLLPFAQIGESVDLAMRGSIPALAILSVLVTQALGAPAPQGFRRGAQAVLLVVLAIGGVTGLREVRRGLAYLPAPRPLCSFSGAWDQSFSAFGKSTYLAPVTALPALMRPAAPTLLPAADPAQCWRRAWMTPR